MKRQREREFPKPLSPKVPRTTLNSSDAGIPDRLNTDDDAKIPDELLKLKEKLAGLDSDTKKQKCLQDDLFSNKSMIDMFVDHRHDHRLEKLNCLVDACCHNAYNDDVTDTSPYIDFTSNVEVSS